MSGNGAGVVVMNLATFSGTMLLDTIIFLSLAAVLICLYLNEPPDSEDRRLDWPRPSFFVSQRRPVSSFFNDNVVLEDNGIDYLNWEFWGQWGLH